MSKESQPNPSADSLTYAEVSRDLSAAHKASEQRKKATRGRRFATKVLLATLLIEGGAGAALATGHRALGAGAAIGGGVVGMAGSELEKRRRRDEQAANASHDTSLALAQRHLAEAAGVQPPAWASTEDQGQPFSIPLAQPLETSGPDET